MKKFYWIFLLLLVVFTACKKKSDNNNTGWTAEDQTFYENILSLQDKACNNYEIWSNTMDSLEAINKLQQFFAGDPSVSSAIIDSMGIAVEYTNGMGGGIFLNTGRVLRGGQTNSVYVPPMSPPVKSLVNIKKMILLSPAYWQFKSSTDTVLQHYNLILPKAGFVVQTVYKNEEATLDRFSELAGYGIIHIDSHGWPQYISKRKSKETYLLTGEIVNQSTTEKYADDIKTGRIIVPSMKKYFLGDDEELSKFYWISGNFIACHNDFSKDTVLFFGSFCYSCPSQGYWTELYKQFAKGTYFGYSGRVQDKYCVIWAMSLMDSLCDTSARTPYNPQKWLDGKVPQKTDLLRTKILFQGDPTLALWKDSVKVETNPITNITQSSATSGGNIKSDGGFPVTARGVCWSTSSNPTTSDRYTADGSGTGIFTSEISGLSGNNTLYYVRAYATNSNGTEYGNQLSFTTTSGHYIGENFGGGIIFYLSGAHGLISAIPDQSDHPWGCEPVDSTALGGTSTAIGTGQANTTAIINGCGEAGIAARICDDLVLEGYSDWFLPSKDELNQMYLQKDVIGGFGSGTYWSSSECNPWIAWSQSFNDGYQWGTNGYVKHTNHWVRAIRAF